MQHYTYFLFIIFSHTNGGTSSSNTGTAINKKTNSFRGLSGNTGGITEGDQPNPNSFMTPYEQLDGESEALVSKLLDVVSEISGSNTIII